MEADDFTLSAFSTRPRIATRYIVRIPVVLRVGALAVDALIVDISNSAPDSRPASPPKEGALVRLELPWFPGVSPASMLCRFVRGDPDGCAVRFCDADPFLRVFVKVARLQDGSPEAPIPVVSNRF
jgi:hypothetical protein